MVGVVGDPLIETGLGTDANAILALLTVGILGQRKYPAAAKPPNISNVTIPHTHFPHAE